MYLTRVLFALLLVCNLVVAAMGQPDAWLDIR